MAVAKKRILIVDDDEDVLKTISSYLTFEGYDVDVAHTGQEALEKSQTHFFNVALLDIRLPDMEGTELLTKMRETRPRMVKIMLTGYPGLDNSVKSINGGAHGYLVKPVDPREISKMIKEKIQEQEKAYTMDQDEIVKYIQSRAQQRKDTEKADSLTGNENSSL